MNNTQKTRNLMNNFSKFLTESIEANKAYNHTPKASVYKKGNTFVIIKDSFINEGGNQVDGTIYTSISPRKFIVLFNESKKSNDWNLFNETYGSKGLDGIIEDSTFIEIQNSDKKEFNFKTETWDSPKKVISKPPTSTKPQSTFKRLVSE